MTSDEDLEHGRILNSERATNERYIRQLRERLKKQREIAAHLDRARNQDWTDPTNSRPRTPLGSVPVSPLIGRVAFDVDDADLGLGLYVGPWNENLDGTLVVNWAAPVARLFFEGRAAGDPVAPHVAGRRSFETRLEQVVSFVDDLESDCTSGESPFASMRSALTVPVPPRPARPPVTSPRPWSAAESPPAMDDVARKPAPSAEPPRAAPSSRPGGPTEALRAEPALRSVLERPRTGSLGSVLATLQSAQYRLVTWPDNDPLVVQGGPGTGKTIVAAHRAAFLTHPERESAPLARVALVGPTSQFVSHVRGAIDDLRGGADDGSSAVRLLSLPAFVGSMAGLPTEEPANLGPSEHVDGAWDLGRFADGVVKGLRQRQPLPRRRRAALVLAINTVIAAPSYVRNLFAGQPELEEWRKGLLNADRVLASHRYQPFLAALGLAISPPSRTVQFDHLLVDEAQDVRPLEWRLLLRHLRAGGQLSLFGDINQRRSDWSPVSWRALAKDLELGEEEGFEPEILTLGYRTTRQILRFANQLLPPGQREATTLREGRQPRVVAVGSHRTISESVRRDLVAAALREVDRLSEIHPRGLVGVISPTARMITDAMRKESWRHVPGRDAWRRGEALVHVLFPDAARGLEFDGVVVVEPANFPPNLGRLGLLYTSLTRAVHDLVVVHALPLPRDLRPPR